MTAPPAPVVIILFALKEMQPISPKVPECFFIVGDLKKLPRLSEASSIILIFFFFCKC